MTTETRRILTEEDGTFGYVVRLDYTENWMSFQIEEV